MNKEKHTFKDLAQPMQDFILNRLIIAGVGGIVLVVLFVLLKAPKFITLVVASVCLYSAYLFFIVMRSLNGKGARYEGIITKVVNEVPTGNIKRAAYVAQKKPINPQITMKTDDGYDIVILVKGANNFAVDNKIAVYAPDGALSQKAKDNFRLTNYYCIEKLYEDYRNEGTVEER